MFERRHRSTTEEAAPTTQVRRSATYAPLARGGVSGGAVLTGVVVAFGAMLLLSALIGGVLAAVGTTVGEVSATDSVNAGIAVGIAFVAATLVAYLWGGYTAGRMGRGAGFLNGLLVPLIAMLIAIIIGVIVNALGATAQLNLPFATSRLPVDENSLVDFGAGIGIGTVVAMFIGGIFGGMLGARWHTKLERRVDTEEHVAERTVTDNKTTGREPVVTRHNDQPETRETTKA